MKREHLVLVLAASVAGTYCGVTILGGRWLSALTRGVEERMGDMPSTFPTRETSRIRAAIDRYYEDVVNGSADEQRRVSSIEAILSAFEGSSSDVLKDGPLMFSVATFYVLRGHLHKESGSDDLASRDFAAASELYRSSGKMGEGIVLDEAAIHMIVSASARHWRPEVRQGGTESRGR